MKTVVLEVRDADEVMTGFADAWGSGRQQKSVAQQARHRR
jgi:hypothetical protein